jgi:CRISPR/Cas system CSM-associated protein Csm2 small subunit
MTSDSISDSEQIAVLDTLKLKFDDGKKWIANIETHQGIQQMDSIISAFKDSKSKDYKTLGDNLSKQTSYVIKNCSMKGEPHDQLHVVLVPMLDEVSILKDHKDTTTSKAALNQLEQLITAYFKYFEVFLQESFQSR